MSWGSTSCGACADRPFPLHSVLWVVSLLLYLASSLQQNLWAEILEDVATQTSKQGRSQTAAPKNILVLGDEGSGKSSVIAHLQNKKVSSAEQTGPQGVGLEFTSLEVKDEDSEDVIERMGVYTLNGDHDHTALLSSVVKKTTVEDLLVMIVVDLSRPWTIMESLKRCAFPPCPFPFGCVVAAVVVDRLLVRGLCVDVDVLLWYQIVRLLSGNQCAAQSKPHTHATLTLRARMHALFILSGDCATRVAGGREYWQNT